MALTLAEVMPRAEIIVVTTPQPAAQRVAQRSAFAARRLKLSVRGVVENMSWFTGDDGTRYELFGAGGGDTLAADLGIPLLGQVPLVAAVRQGADEGRPIVAVDPAERDGAGVHRHRRAPGLPRAGPGLPQGAQPALVAPVPVRAARAVTEHRRRSAGPRYEPTPAGSFSGSQPRRATAWRKAKRSVMPAT